MSTIVIELDGVDITDDVMLSGASFASQVNGAVGQASFKVKDVAQTYDFNSGDSLTVDVDGVRVWGGYVMQAKKIYALPVIDSSSPGDVTRVWQVNGLDYNVLFSKRIVFKESDPTGKVSFSYDADTYDDTIIEDIFDNYLDIGGDGLSSSGVTRIAKAILDVPGKTHSGSVASAGFTWKQMMDTVQRATGGVYYISPDKVLTYVDAETTTSAYTLNDVPTGGFDIGYQKFNILNDGVNLVNDMMVWGAGNGSPNYVFSRTEDSASISAHGRWQLGLVTSGLFRQASADIVADSYVYGTPQSHRGGKDDAIVFSARVFRPVFQAGDIVDIECAIFGYSDTLPLRSMTITFASPTEAIFDLVLTHAIDQGVSIYEYLVSKIDIPAVDVTIVDPPPPPPPPSPGCTQSLCLVVAGDDFLRTVVAGAGTSASGINWNTQTSPGGSDYGVDGTALFCGLSGGTFRVRTDPGFGPWVDDSDFISLQTRFWFHQDAGVFANFGSFNMELRDDSGNHVGWDFQINGTGGGFILSSSPSGGVTNYSLPSAWSTIDYSGSPVWFRVSWITRLSTGEVSAKVWLETDGEPDDWQVTAPVGFRAPLVPSTTRLYLEVSSSLANRAEYVDYINFTYDRCAAVQFDNFNRVVSGAFGVASGGYSWTTRHSAGSPAPTVSVDGMTAVVSYNNNAITGQMVASPGPWDNDFTMTARVYLMGQVGFPTPGRTQLEFSIDDYGTGITGLGGPDHFATLWIDGWGQAYLDGGAIDTGTLMFGDGWRMVKWQFSFSGNVRAKIWPDGDPEPTDWSLERLVSDGWGPYPFTPVGFTVETYGTTTLSEHIQVDYIDFDYDGRPCYLSCDDVLFDDFNRANDPTGWGTASGGTVYSSGAFGSGTSFYVDSNVGWLYQESSGGIIYFGPNAASGGDDVGPYSSTTPWTFSCKFKTPNWTYDGSDASIDGTGLVTFRAEDRRIFFYIGTTVDGDLNVLSHGQIQTDDSATLEFDWHPDTWYQVKWYYNFVTGDSWLKVWEDGDTEPDWMITESSYGGLGGDTPVTYFSIHTNNFAGSGMPFNPGNPAIFGFDDIVFSACVPVEPTSGPPSSGYVCETVVHALGGTTFVASHAFFSGSLEVWVNGTAQTGFTFTAVSGEFTLSAAITADDVLRICYRANGDPI